MHNFLQDLRVPVEYGLTNSSVWFFSPFEAPPTDPNTRPPSGSIALPPLFSFFPQFLLPSTVGNIRETEFFFKTLCLAHFDDPRCLIISFLSFSVSFVYHLHLLAILRHYTYQLTDLLFSKNNEPYAASDAGPILDLAFLSTTKRIFFPSPRISVSLFDPTSVDRMLFTANHDFSLDSIKYLAYLRRLVFLIILTKHSLWANYSLPSRFGPVCFLCFPPKKNVSTKNRPLPTPPEMSIYCHAEPDQQGISSSFLQAKGRYPEPVVHAVSSNRI